MSSFYRFKNWEMEWQKRKGRRKRKRRWSREARAPSNMAVMG